MAGNLLRLPAKAVKPGQLSMFQQVAGAHHVAHHHGEPRDMIGTREVVGYGINGRYNYIDHIMFPYPAIRFREPTHDIVALKEKEKGDWKKLSVEDKKQLYRASFCSTFSEMNAPTGRWKSITGIALGCIGLSWWMYIWVRTYVYPPLPESLSLERRQAQLRRMIDLRVDPITGIGSKWDYENNCWKK